MSSEREHEIGRRSFLLSAGALAAAPLLGGIGSQASAQPGAGVFGCGGTSEVMKR